VLLRRVHGRYAQYYNARVGRSGHLWQNRFFACVPSESHLWSALAYVDLNPVRAGLVEHATDYSWSSALPHLIGVDARGLLDEAWWRDTGAAGGWLERLAADHSRADILLRRCTHSGQPFGDESFVREMSERFDRHWVRGRPRKEAGPSASAAENHAVQAELF
jgi:putative transposase